MLPRLRRAYATLLTSAETSAGTRGSAERLLVPTAESLREESAREAFRERHATMLARLRFRAVLHHTHAEDRSPVFEPITETRDGRIVPGSGGADAVRY